MFLFQIVLKHKGNVTCPMKFINLCQVSVFSLVVGGINFLTAVKDVKTKDV